MVETSIHSELPESVLHDSYDALHSLQAHSQCRPEPHPETHQYQSIFESLRQDTSAESIPSNMVCSS